MNTPVIFRKYKNNQIIAVFPTELGSCDSYQCQSYMTIGQHGSCDPNVIQDTNPASAAEYYDLFSELVSLGYENLQVYHRYQQMWTRVRRDKLNQY